jgi:hypothetical protein
MWMRHAKQHDSEHCPLTQPCLPLNADTTAVCAAGYTGRKRGEVVRTRTVARRDADPSMDRYLCWSRQWRLSQRTCLSTPVHYDLFEALCPHAQRVALVRLDGQYGDTVAMAQLLKAGVYFVTRARGYHVLEHPQIQGVLAHPPTASVTRVNSDEVVELFDGGWLQLDGELPPTRVIVARHRAPAPGKRVSVGKCRGRVGV